MVALKAHEADRALARPDPRWRVFLIYGPDQGLVRERTEAVLARHVRDLHDPFQMVRLDGGDIAADPLRLSDEANTRGLFGEQRAIRVGTTTRPLHLAVEPLLAMPPQDAIVVLEAGDLTRTHPLRTMVEKAATGVAIPCYADQGRSLAVVVDAVLADHVVAIDPEAKSLLLARLGADRQLSRRELEKLMLFVHPRQRIGVEDVLATVGDAAAKDTDDLVDASFCGDLRALERAWTRLTGAGEDPSVLLGFALRHGQALALARATMEEKGVGAGDAAAGLRGLSFLRKPAVEASLRRHSAGSLLKATHTVQNAITHTRRQPALAPALALRALWSVAMSPGSSDR